MRVILSHLLTKQVGQNERQKQHQMAVVTGTCVASGFLLLLQLLENIRGGKVDWSQTRMGTLHEMAARLRSLCVSFFSLLGCRPSYPEWKLDTHGNFEEWPSERI